MSILDKIRKLHALSENNDSIEQANSAMAKIQELCFIHNLELEQALQDSQETKLPYKAFPYLLPEADKTNVFWKHNLLYYIALGNFGSIIYYSGTTKTIILAQDHNREVIVFTYEYLSKELERLARRSCADQGLISKVARWKYEYEFCRGATSALYYRIVEQKEKQAKENKDCTDLVVVKDKELDEFKKQLFPKAKPGRQHKINDHGAYSEGQKAGNTVPINQGINQNHIKTLA